MRIPVRLDKHKAIGMRDDIMLNLFPLAVLVAMFVPTGTVLRDVFSVDHSSPFGLPALQVNKRQLCKQARLQLWHCRKANPALAMGLGKCVLLCVREQPP